MGEVYKDSSQLKDVLVDLVSGILQKENKKDFLEKKIKVIYHIKDPDFSFILDPENPDIYLETDDTSADISLTMQADFMHNFWLKRTNILESIKNGNFKVEMAPKIATAKLIDLLPVLAKGLEIYPEICSKKGIAV